VWQPPAFETLCSDPGDPPSKNAITVTFWQGIMAAIRAPELTTTLSQNIKAKKANVTVVYETPPPVFGVYDKKLLTRWLAVLAPICTRFRRFPILPCYKVPAIGCRQPIPRELWGVKGDTKSLG